ncbi:MAG: hypothetical protein ABI614_20520, partial [Planctomycetota bacterium]
MKCFFHLSAITVMAVGLACFVGCEPQPKTPGEKLDKAIDDVQGAGEELSREAQEAAGEIRDEFKPRPPVDINVG